MGVVEQGLINKVLNDFRAYKGRSYVTIPSIEVIEQIVHKVITSALNKNNNANILLVSNEYKTVCEIRDNYVENRRDVINRIKCLTSTYLHDNSPNFYNIIIGVDFTDINNIINIANKNFCLFLFTICDMDFQSIVEMNKVLKEITHGVSKTELNLESINRPVEERRVPVSIDDDDRESYNKYNNLVKEFIIKFGDFDNINKCRKGDPVKNISASQFRYELAIANGWSPTLDMTIPFHREIDKVYSPIAIEEAANNVYDVIRSRREFVANHKNKIQKVIDIIKENDGKRILVISKNDNFCYEISSAIRDSGVICGDIHNAIPDTYLYDEFGDKIVYKSGERKGEVKIFKSKAVSSHYKGLYEKGYINVLSIKESSPTSLKLPYDILIFTSSLTSNVTEFRKRCNQLKCLQSTAIVYQLYIESTIEEEKFAQLKSNPNIKVIEPEKEVVYDENSGDIIL